jgi:hypothetical protein
MTRLAQIFLLLGILILLLPNGCVAVPGGPDPFPFELGALLLGILFLLVIFAIALPDISEPEEPVADRCAYCGLPTGEDAGSCLGCGAPR